ncbi:MAG TPA: LD-carboxypeptidase [Candidatus Binataceae bacterium]|nr:LD-carboxypeptidase [Candidatus Binataceae bacterium]
MDPISIKPKALKRGDTVAVVAPASAIEREHLERGVNVLTEAGYRVKVSERALSRWGIFAGEDRARADELQAAFADPEVKAIFCARGGYGCGRILPMLDFSRIAKTPKVFVGFSDETFLLCALNELVGLVSFHGPMVAMDLSRGMSERALVHMQRVLGGDSGTVEFEARETMHPGVAEGRLIGGCLTVVASMVGTPYAPSFAGRILFLEDTGERAYRIDRMLVQLRQSGALKGVAGIVFGNIRLTDHNEQEARLVARFCAEETADLDCPVIFGIEAGHGTENLMLPFGVNARIEAASRRLVVTEIAVER